MNDGGANGSSALVPRVLGRVDGLAPGRTVVVTGGLHGNEPAGVKAIQRVLDRLGGRLDAGLLVGVAGNLGALSRDVRYLDRDLNRGWTAEALAHPDPGIAECAEQQALLRLFRPLMDSSMEPVVFLDLHTMSGPGAPFVCMADVLRNRSFAFELRLPVVLGLEEVIEGSMLGYLCDLGHIGVALEGGQHSEPAAVDRLEAAIWLTLRSAGNIQNREAFRLPAHQRRLQGAGSGHPKVVEIRHRHVCREDDGFVMEPGFKSFQPLAKGELVARDRRGPIRAPQSGRMLLPRYQGSGEDGYFVAREVNAAWLKLSAQLRSMSADRILTRMPGIREDPHRAETYLVDPRWAARPVIDLFHLFGFRRVRPEGASLAFSRRKPL